jgi:hypothetical protein
MSDRESRERRWLSAKQWIDENPGFAGKNFVYDACRRGDLPSIRIGRKIFIPDDALEIIANRTEHA